MSKCYKTGDVTFTDGGYIRIYLNERDICGYFFSSGEGRGAVFIERKPDCDSLYAAPSEPVICTIDDVMEAIRATYGKEIR